MINMLTFPAHWFKTRGAITVENPRKIIGLVESSKARTKVRTEGTPSELIIKYRYEG